MTEFEIYGKGTRNYKINNDNYIVKVKGIDIQQNFESRGIIDSLLLINDNGKKTKIVKLRNIGK